MKNITVYYTLRGHKKNILIEIEEVYIENGFYIWQKVITSLHKLHNVDNVASIEIGDWED